LGSPETPSSTTTSSALTASPPPITTAQMRSRIWKRRSNSRISHRERPGATWRRRCGSRGGDDPTDDRIRRSLPTEPTRSRSRERRTAGVLMAPARCSVGAGTLACQSTHGRTSGYFQATRRPSRARARASRGYIVCLVSLFRSQRPPLAGWSAITARVVLTYAATIVVGLAAQQAGRPDLIRSPKRVLAHTWEGLLDRVTQRPRGTQGHDRDSDRIAEVADPKLHQSGCSARQSSSVRPPRLLVLSTVDAPRRAGLAYHDFRKARKPLR
jgi:hypothetical protein